MALLSTIKNNRFTLSYEYGKNSFDLSISEPERPFDAADLTALAIACLKTANPDVAKELIALGWNGQYRRF